MELTGQLAKRVVDVLVASALILATLPLCVLIALVLLLTMGRPVIFAQQRPGLKGQPFTIYKFRTMRLGRVEVSNSDKQRLTPFGSFLRSSSLDELPSLFNVLRGDMSLVGPRPLLPEYLPLYTAVQARRHEVRPGITGWAQVNGRNALGWDQKLALDVWYVDNRTWLLDLKIVLLTVWRVVSRSGVSQEGHVTVERFRGSRG